MIAKIGNLNNSISDEGARARDKELVRGIKVLENKNGDSIVDCRLYMGRNSTASTVYCNIWVCGLKFDGATIYGSASGKAGGYGYHRTSAAVSSALDTLGVKLYQDDGIEPANIAGVGDSAIREALLAVAVALGYSAENLIYVECYA